MKLKYIIILVIGVFSFYYSDKLIIYIENNSPLMKEINKVYEEYNTSPVNAEIKDNTIIPGVKGKEVDKRESYLKMNEFGVFNDTFMVYKYIKPEVSLDDNLDKYIISSRKTSYISIITDNINVSSILNELNIKHSLIITESNKKNDNMEYINGNNEKNKYNELDQYLNKNKINKKICIEGINDINYCILKKYYLVKLNNIITKNNLKNSILKINGGSFIYINDNLSKNEVELIINQIKKSNIKIDFLSNLISEN